MANRTVTQLTAVLQMNNSKFKKGLTGSQKALKAFQKQVKAVGGMIAGAFAVTALVNFGREAVQLAAKLQGVESAFNKLNDPNLLNDLRAATRGMVSDLELMKQAVRAKNFAIPLKDLATFFEFATKRSLETGESVDYLVNSIIDGIGRKSTLVMDNLGISATQLQAEIRKTGDFAVAAGNLIKEGIEDMGEVADTAMVSMVAAQATWDNFKAKAGGKILTVVARNIDDFNARLSILGNDEVDILTKLWAATSGEMDAVIALDKKWKEYYKSIEKPKWVVEEITWTYKEIKSGIDWADVNDKIFQQWVKENGIIRARIALQNQLTEAVNATALAQLTELKKIAAAYDKQRKKEKADADAKRDAKNAILDNQHYGDYLTQPDEVWGGGAEPWEAGIDTTAIANAAAKMEEAEQAAKDFGETFEAMLEMGLAKGVSDLFAGIGEAFVSGNMDGAFLSILESVGKFMVQMGSMFVAYGIAASAFFAAITAGPYGAVAAIAAGAALAAIGGAIIGTAKNMSSTGSSSTGGVSSQGSWGHDVRFKIQGKDLVGALSRYNDTNFLNT